MIIVPLVFERGRIRRGAHGSLSRLPGLPGVIERRGSVIEQRQQCASSDGWPGDMPSLVRGAGDGDRVLMRHDGLFIGAAAFQQSFAALHQPQRMYVWYGSLRLT
jgi:hypothetical protein